MTEAGSTVKTRIFCISDTHQGHPRLDPYSKDGAFRPPWPENIDILLHSGDITLWGGIHEYEESLKMLASIPAELKLVIAGNHDLTLHESYYLNDRDKNGKLHAENVLETFGKLKYDAEDAHRARELWNGPQVPKAGVTYLTEGMHTFTLKNGAQFTIYASPWQPEFYNWAFNYPRDEDRWNPAEVVEGENVKPAPPERDPHPIPVGAHVDLMMTHGPPHLHLDKCTGAGHRAGCPHLLKALNRVRPRLHCFGHIHEAWGAERITWKAKDSSAAGKEAGTLGEITEILGGSDDGKMGVTPDRKDVIRASDSKVIEQRGGYIDVSAGSSNPLRFGEETLLLNSCVVDVDYQTVNAGWLISLELPKK